MLASNLGAESMEVMGITFCEPIWGEIEPVEPEEVDRGLLAASSATCVLDLCSSCLIKA